MKRLGLLSSVLATLMLSVAPVGAATTGNLALSEAANHQSENTVVGRTVTVVLHSTYWGFLAPSNANLRPSGPAVYHPAPRTGPGSCFPGMGCGTISINYRAQRVGRVVLSASRTSCGEALMCTGTRGRWSTTIVVR
ncbi:MAG: hypothetical protein WCJ82_05540 [Actinomycetota bacterium]